MKKIASELNNDKIDNKTNTTYKTINLVKLDEDL